MPALPYVPTAPSSPATASSNPPEGRGSRTAITPLPAGDSQRGPARTFAGFGAAIGRPDDPADGKPDPGFRDPLGDAVAAKPWYRLLPTALALLVLYCLVLRFTAYLLGADAVSLQRDYQSREGLPAMRVEPLAAYCVFPVSIYANPGHLVVLASLLAVIMLMPQAAARIYGRAVGMTFLAAAVIVGSWPWLAAALIPGVLLHSSGLKAGKRAGPAMMLGLLPVIVWAIAAVDAARDLPGKTPVARWAAYFPVLAALPVAVITGWLFLRTVRLGQARSFVVLPAAGAVCAAPAVVFFLAVGRAELEFALLRRYHDPQVRFAAIPSRDRIVEELRRRGIEKFEDWWDEGAAVEELDAVALQRVLVLRMRRETGVRCRHFARSFPATPQAADALYYGALAQDMVLDEETFLRNGTLRFHAPVTRADGLPYWRALVLEHPDHPLRVPAEYRLILWCAGEVREALRTGDRVAARDKLVELESRLDSLATLRVRLAPSAPPEQGEGDRTGGLLAAFGFLPPPEHPALVTGAVAEAEAFRRTALPKLKAAVDALKPAGE